MVRHARRRNRELPLHLAVPALTIGTRQLDRILPLPPFRELQSLEDIRSLSTHTMAHVLGCSGVRAPRGVVD